MRSPRDQVAAVLEALGARAAGLWRVEGRRLVQVAFVACDDMPAEVAEGFAAATVAVPLDRPELGIVRAAVDGRVTVSRVDELPPEVGSGLWLPRFGAVRSVAVPLTGPSAAVAAVFSVAMPTLEPPDDAVADVVRAHASA